MELEVQKFLRKKLTLWTPAGCLDSLKAKYAIDYKQHSLYPQLYLLKYNQLESPFNERIVQECRGLILDSADNWKVISAPFWKFFNYGQSEAATIDWATAKVQEKLDGSLIQVYWYNNKLQVATSGCPDGANKINDLGNTFAELFWACFNQQGLWRDWITPGFTFMFELMSPFNRVVVDHKFSSIRLIGCRNLQTLKEVDIETIGAQYQWPKPLYYNLSSVEECIEAAQHLDPLRNEGYVVVDQYFNRIKIKSPNYIILHHLRDTCSIKKMAEVIRQGESEELRIALDSYPELKVRFDELVEKYKSIVAGCWEYYIAIAGIQNQKEFAEKALQSPYSSVLFAMRKTNKTPVEIIKDLTENAYLRLMEVK